MIIAMKKVTNTISKSENEVEDMTEEKTDKIIELLEEISRWVNLKVYTKSERTYLQGF